MRHHKFRIATINTWAVIVALSIFLSACGGGGGSGIDARCDGYCKFACQKSVNCGFVRGPVTSQELQICVDSCNAALVDGSDGEGCARSTAVVASATCHELAVLLGLARQKQTTDDVVAFHLDSMEVGQVCGAMVDGF